MRTFILFGFILIFKNLIAQEMPAYVIYDIKGKPVSYSKMIKAMKDKKYVFYGELHDNPIAHWMELEILKQLYTWHGQKLIAGSEMFEHDNQTGVNAYLSGSLTEKTIKDSVRLWPNYETDYRPMLDYAKENHIPWIATNIPRKYASLVYKKGVKALDSLSTSEKANICPLPYVVDTSLSQYAALTNGQMHMGGNFVYSQAIKDATMAWFLIQSMKSESVFYHVNGAYHSDYKQSILWYVEHYTKASHEAFLSISTVTQEDVSKLEKEHLGKADFIICVPESMTRTY